MIRRERGSKWVQLAMVMAVAAAAVVEVEVVAAVIRGGGGDPRKRLARLQRQEH